jgi:ferritin-like metal-binding protein YciE
MSSSLGRIEGKRAVNLFSEAKMKENQLRELYLEQLRDLYSAETQLVKSLPKMAEAATSEELRTSFQRHLSETQEHVRRLETIFENLSQKPTGEKCKGMEGLIKEGSEVIANDEFEGELKDAALIAAAQRVEHYEIAGYGTVRTFANLLEDDEALDLLEQTLDEEKETDQKLTEIAESVNVEAQGGQEAEQTSPEGGSQATTGKKTAA